MQYTYDATGLRQSKTVNGVTTSHIWDGTNMIAETNGDGDVTNKYYRGLGLIYGEFDGNKNYYVSNAHGDICLLLDGNSNITKQYEYDAFEVELNKDNSDINPFRYCGEYYDKETDSIYLRARCYDPATSRMLSEDPARVGTNWYIYCFNDPINFTDPSGLIPSPMEAAHMAQHIYDFDTSDTQYNRTIRIDDVDTGWRLVDVLTGREDMKMGFYIRGDEHSSYDGPIEYTVVFKGTDTAGGWKNNFEQAVSAKSADTWDAINCAYGFVNSKAGIEITFVGHSKGGQEAASAALKTNKNAIIFNPAAVNAGSYGLSVDGYTASMTAFIVEGEALDILNRKVLGATPIDNRVDLPSDNWNPISKHSMREVIKGVRKKGC